MYRHVSLAARWSSKSLPTSPTLNPLFSKFSKSIHINSIQSPSIVSSSFSASKFRRSLQSLLHSSSTSVSFSRSFCSGASVADEVSSLGKESLVSEKEREEEDSVGDEEHGRLKSMPQSEAVVLVLCTRAEPDVTSPWRRELKKSYGTGLILSGRRLLTTAHSVDHHTQLEVVKCDSGAVYAATMLAIAPECDLAILTVDDDEFWNGVKPVKFGRLPFSGDKVIVTCLQEDRDHVQLTTYAVRTGMVQYSFWGFGLLALKIKVDLTGATCGGLAFDERGKCVGLKHQTKVLLKLRSKSTTDTVSYFTPAKVIKHFIQDHDKNGAYTGFPLLGIEWQYMESPYLRASMKMEDDEQGVLITAVKPNYPESVILKPNDIILSIDGINISNEGTVSILRGRQTEFYYLIARKYVGDRIGIKVRRGLEICEFTIELATHRQFIPANIVGRPFRYYIIGGFVFTTLSFPLMQIMDDRYHYHSCCFGAPMEDELLSQTLYEERVVLCQVLKADINAGYEMDSVLQNKVLLAFNDKPVEGLNCLVCMVGTCNEDFMKFTFANHKIMVLPTNIARSTTPDILKAHSVSCAMSDDLKELVKLA